MQPYLPPLFFSRLLGRKIKSHLVEINHASKLDQSF